MKYDYLIVGCGMFGSVFARQATDAGKKVLHLNLYKEYFDAIYNKTKTIEYRQMTKYWANKLYATDATKYDYILFRNGYQTIAPEMLVEGPKSIEVVVREDKERGKCPHLALELGDIIKVENYPT